MDKTSTIFSSAATGMRDDDCVQMPGSLRGNFRYLAVMQGRQFSNDHEIARAGRKFLDLSLPKPEWTHAAHFAVTLWLMRHRPDLDLETEMPGLIRAFNEATGTPNTDTGGYHETITRASLGVTRMVLASAPARPLHEILDMLLASPLGDSKWLLSYWSREKLFSVEARRNWLAPDLKPLIYEQLSLAAT